MMLTCLPIRLAPHGYQAWVTERNLSYNHSSESQSPDARVSPRFASAVELGKTRRTRAFFRRSVTPSRRPQSRGNAGFQAVRGGRHRVVFVAPSPKETFLP